MNSRANEVVGALQQENEFRAKDCEAYEGRVVELRKDANYALQ